MKICNYNKLPFVSIIIVNYNGKNYLDECLKSLEKINYPKDKFEVIVVDNASKDGSVKHVNRYFPWVKILQLDKNYGFCKPNNEGARIAKGEYLVFLNNDTVVTKNWLLELIKGALSNEEIVCCASKILYLDEKNVINVAGGKLTIIGGGFYRGYGEKDVGQYNKQEYTGFGCGAGVLVKKDFFLRIGGFDPDYFASCEEHDLGWKVWLYGYKFLYVPTAVMYHKESGTYGTRSSFQPIKVYLITRNRLRNIFKNLEAINVIQGLAISIIFDIYRSLRYFFSQNYEALISIIRAYINFLHIFPKLTEKRVEVQMNRKRYDKDLYKLGVIATLRESVAEELRLTRNIWRRHNYKVK